MAIPMIDDVELKAVQVIRQETDQDFVEHKIAGLDGTLHQHLGRGSHRVFISGVLLPATAEAELRKLQQKAAAGDEVTFSADITTALTISKMVIERFRAEQRVGPAGQIAYEILLAESPALPAAAEVTAFGGLDGVAGAVAGGAAGIGGAGSLGFDPAALDSVLEDVSSQAAAAVEAADKIAAVIDQVNALSKIADLRNLGNPVRPLAETVSRISAASKKLDDTTNRFNAIPGAQP